MILIQAHLRCPGPNLTIELLRIVADLEKVGILPQMSNICVLLNPETLQVELAFMLQYLSASRQFLIIVLIHGVGLVVLLWWARVIGI